MSLTEIERTKILDAIKTNVLEKHIDPKNANTDYKEWIQFLEAERPRLLAVSDPEQFERGVNDILAALNSSSTHFFHQSGRGSDLPPQRAINATLLPIETSAGRRWMFADVIEEGAAWRFGIKPGELLISIDSKRLTPPNLPFFRLGTSHLLELSTLAGEARNLRITIPDTRSDPKNRPPMIEPPSLSYSSLDTNTGYIRISAFPAIVGYDFAKSLDSAIGKLKANKIDRLIVDLRGNCGGGLGSLRLMSYLCPGKVEVGHSITRKRMASGYDKTKLTRIGKIPSTKPHLYLMFLRFALLNKDRSLALITEGLGRQPFHGRTVILVNQHTTGGAENVVHFAKEHALAAIVGVKTPGMTLGSANFVLPQGYRLRLPVAAWYSWGGTHIEGQGIEPDVSVQLSPEGLAQGKDTQLLKAMEVLTTL